MARHEINVVARNTEEPESLNARFTLAVVVAFALLVILGIVLIQGFYFRAARRQRVADQTAPSEALREMESRQKGQMTYRWVDKNQHVVAVPIERAMAATAEELQPKERRTARE